MPETTLQIDRYLREYREAAKCMGAADPANARQYATQLRAAYAQLVQSSGGQEAIASLLNEYNPHVRLIAAVHSLDWKPEMARQALQGLAEGGGPHSFEAMWVYAEYSRGLRRKHYDICDRILSLASLRRLLTSRYILGKQGSAVTSSELTKLIQNNGMTRLNDSLHQRAQHSIRLRTKIAQEGEIAMGASQFGGAPDLPDGIAWPTYNHRPMSFIAQIRLSEIAPHDPRQVFPKDGILYFFYAAEPALGDEPGYPPRCKVLFAPEARHLTPAIFPPKLPQPYRFTQQAVNITSEVLLPLPAWDSMDLYKLPMSDEEQERYSTLLNQMVALQRDSAPGKGGGGIHRMLGYPDYRMIDVFYECPEPAGAQHWQLLLQVDTEERAGMHWRKQGRLFFCIRRNDLLARNFSMVWTVLQEE